MGATGSAEDIGVSTSHEVSQEILNIEVQHSNRFRHFVSSWQRFTDDPIILEWVERYKIIFMSLPFRNDDPSVLS